MLCNSLSWSRKELVTVDSSAVDELEQEDLNGKAYLLVDVNALAVEQYKPVSFSPVSVQRMSRDDTVSRLKCTSGQL